MRREEFGVPIGHHFKVPEELAGYVLRDPLGQRIGKVEEVFANATGELEYIKVKIGGIFDRRSILLPVEGVAVDEGQRALVLK